MGVLTVGNMSPRTLADAIGRLTGDAELRRVRAGGLATAPRHTEAVMNAVVERAALEAA